MSDKSVKEIMRDLDVAIALQHYMQGCFDEGYFPNLELVRDIQREYRRENYGLSIEEKGSFLVRD
jgi:hypothetical protein